MTPIEVDGQLGRQVVIDGCPICQVFWFDTYESLQLAPGAILRLFRLIGRHASAVQRPADTARCPRCGRGLALAHDMQRDVRFEYYRCPDGHGRLITFVNFLREKNFVRPLSPDQVEALRRQLRVVRCSNCGAPVDLVRGSTCAHCGSPLSMLDMAQARNLIATLRQGEASKGKVDPALPLNLARARAEVESTFEGLEGRGHWAEEAATLGLVGAGLSALARWLKEE